MSKYFKDVGWILFGGLCIVITLIIIYFAFMNMISGSWGWAILLFLIGTILIVMAFVAFRQASRQTSS